MVSLVFNCLIKASEKRYTSIAFPALGTGVLKYPVQHVVQLMYKAIRLFNEGKGTGSISEIIIVIYPETKLSVKQVLFTFLKLLFLCRPHLRSCRPRCRNIVAQGYVPRACQKPMSVGSNPDYVCWLVSTRHMLVGFTKGVNVKYIRHKRRAVI